MEDYWSPIVTRNALVEGTVLSNIFCRSGTSFETFKSFTQTIYSYDGEMKEDAFISDINGKMDQTLI